MEIWLADVNREWKKKQQKKKLLNSFAREKVFFIKEILLCVGMFFVIFNKHTTTIVGRNSFIPRLSVLSVGEKSTV